MHRWLMLIPVLGGLGTGPRVKSSTLVRLDHDRPGGRDVVDGNSGSGRLSGEESEISVICEGRRGQVHCKEEI
jgi:hypothetical protein